MKVESKLVVDVTIPDMTLPRHVAWNAGMNLLKSSMMETRRIGYNVCEAILDHDMDLGKATRSKRVQNRNHLAYGNPK